MRSLPSRSSKPVRTVVHDGGDCKLAAELKDLRAGQRYLLDALEQFGKRIKSRPNQQQVSDARSQAALPTNWADRRAQEGDGGKQARRNTACFACGKEGHYAKNCDQGRSESRDLRCPRPERPHRVRLRCGRTVVFASGEDSRRMYLEILINGNPINCILDTGSEVTLIPGSLTQKLPKKPVTSQTRAANGTIIEVLEFLSLPWC